MIRVYKTGIHLGEEQQVQGNECSGMVYFSGCHLACNFCYTPEMSQKRQGVDYTEEEFLNLLKDLVNKGAQNINLITPTHLWGKLKAPLKTFKNKYKNTPLILKTSGFQNKKVASEMSQIGDIIVMDFKVLSAETAKAVNLPNSYGETTLAQLNFLNDHLPQEIKADKINKGVLIRHLVMPGYLSESLKVIKAINTSQFKGVLNIMTIFLNPKTNKITKLAPSELKQIMSEVNENLYQVLVNGKAVRA